MARLTNEEKGKLAYVLLSQAGNIVENLESGNTAYLQEIEKLNPQDVAEQLGKWLAKLPGDSWDNRLPQPK